MSPVVPPFHPSHPPFPPRRRLTVAASMTARLICSAALLAATRYAPAADLFYLGAQYTPGPGLPAPWPTDGSWFDKNLWQNNTLPTSTTNAIFGSNQPMPNTNTTHAPHTLHFGNFGYYGTTTIPGGIATVGTITILSDAWTFDSQGGKNPDFIGYLPSSLGRLSVSTLTLSPATGQSASLTLQNGSLTAPAIILASQVGSQALLTIAPAITLTNSTATLGAVGVGSLVQTGGLFSISGTLNLGNASSASGTYNMTAGTLATSIAEIIGNSGTGTVTQSGGMHTSDLQYNTTSGVYLGYGSKAVGVYNLSSGQFSAYAEFIGYSGTGMFTQTGGSHVIYYASSGGMYVGYKAGAVGSYTLSGGLLRNSGSEYLGYSGVGNFNQTDGTHILSGGLRQGYTTGATGVYTLSAGTLTASGAHLIGVSGAGTFDQSGGVYTTSTICIGVNAGGVGRYSFSAGSLSAGNVYLGGSDTAAGGTGTFTMSDGIATLSGALKLWNTTGTSFAQSGGTLTLQTLDLFANPNAFAWTGGTLCTSGTTTASTITSSLTIPAAGTFQGGGIVQGSLANNGVLAVGNSLGTLTVQGNYTQSAPAALQLELAGTTTAQFDRLIVQGNLNLAGTIALGLRPGYTPALNDIWDLLDWTGTFTNSGYSFDFSKAPLPAPLGWNTSAFATTGRISVAKFIYNRAWLGSQYTPGPTYPAPWPTRGSWFDSGNWQDSSVPSAYDSATFGSNASMPNDNTTHDPHIIHFGNFGHVGTTVIPGGAASINQASFLSDAWTFDFASGQNPDFTGTLTPSTGALTVATLTMSPAAGQSTSLTVLNGTLTATTLTLATQAGSALLTIGPGATVKTTSGTIGVAGSGTVTQTGGVHSLLNPSTLFLAYNAGASGQYNLSDGQLATPNGETIGWLGHGSFFQSGGTHTVSSTLYLGNREGSQGDYTLTGGTLTAKTEQVGMYGTGVVIQTGGFNDVSNLYFGYFGGSSASGSYTLSDGTLNVTQEEKLGTYQCRGDFTQSGGTHTVGATLAIAPSANSAGTYRLTGGQLSATSERIGSASPSPTTQPSDKPPAGTFTQEGGTNTTGSLQIGVFCLYQMTGGTLSVKTLDLSLNPAGFAWSAGTLIITGPTAPALTVPTAGTLLGAPTIAGSLTNNGLLSPGQSPGLLTVQGDFTQSDTATLLLEIAGPALPDFDRLSVPGTSTLPGNITLAGTLALSFLPTYTPALGHSFDFLDWTGIFTPNGYTFDFTRAPLPTGWTWDTSAFNTTGQLTITQALPEPASLALLALAAPFLLTRRRP